MTRTLLLCLVLAPASTVPAADIVDKRALLDAQTFWDNRDRDWFTSNIPFLETPDAELDTTYYYRWEVVTKHLVYGSPASGWAFTEFIDRPFWSGAYGAISCPAGHQLYEVRWLRDRSYARDYARYWLRHPGAQPRRYSTWLADSVWAIRMVQGDEDFAVDLLDDLKKNFAAWEERHFVPEVGLFWQTGHDDGMEFNINSRQTQDIVRGAPGYRPSFNAYMYADAVAIAKIARAAGDEEIARRFDAKAASIKKLVQEKLWDPRREFFFPMFKNDEERDGFVNKALTLTYETGRYAGSDHGRELIGYVPWQFNLPDDDRGFEAAWRFLMDRDYFFADFGPSFTERHDPLFLITDRCCWWSGQSWPYANSQTLVAMANLLNNYEQDVVSKADYYTLLRTYALTHRKDGRPYIAEAANPDTGSWKGYDNFNHSEHYFHSGFTDLVISGLFGLRPRADDILDIHPLAPDAWDWFALVDVPYRDCLVSIVWDRSGARYGRGAGLHLFAGDKKIASRPELGPLTAKLPHCDASEKETPRAYNFAVNNDGGFYPRLTASYSGERTSPQTAQDGQYWYHVSPPNRWTTEGSPNKRDWLALDFGIERAIHEIRLYFLDDEGGTAVRPPASVELEYLAGERWKSIPEVKQRPESPAGRRANVFKFEPLRARKLRVTLTSREGAATGLSEFETWGPRGEEPLEAPQPPPSLATNRSRTGYPKPSASHTSRYDRVEFVNDGVVNFRPSPNNRWTAYESKSETDWLEIDFGKVVTAGRAELHIYDDRGGVQPPASYAVQYLDGDEWRDVRGARKSPEKPRGGTMNTVTFEAVRTSRLRVVFTHAGGSRSGLTEIEVWEK